jgi:hypothetical protein
MKNSNCILPIGCFEIRATEEHASAHTSACQMPPSSSPVSLTALLDQLPGSLGWGVLFRTRALAELIASNQLVRMLGLPPDVDVGKSASVALTSAGKCLAFGPEGPWLWSLGRPPVDADINMADRFGDRLAMLPAAEDADCIGFGQLPGLSPVVLALTIDGGIAAAEALFETRPPEDHYDLLAAAGVRYLGGEQRGQYWCAHFTNRLGDHLHSGAIAGFARTAHCNLFFLHHGRIDGRLEAGLLSAAAARIEHGLRMAIATAINLVLVARQRELAMTCIPPAPQASYPCGDLVPLGLLTCMLRSMANPAPAIEAAVILSDKYLDSHRAGNLWPFHHGRLPTATDSALILLGRRNDTEAIDTLERFTDSSGGYLPQLSNAEGDELHMREDEAQRHWRQADFGTTCLVRALRRSAGLEERTSTAWIEAWYERRAALFFANPYLVDWALALAIAEDDGAVYLRHRLTAEILASANDDGSFGRYDQPLSTALAIVALASLGHRGRAIRVAQLQLLEMLESQGRGVATTPFYASLKLPDPATAGAIRGRGLLSARGQWHTLSLYEDTHRMVLNAFAGLALQAPCDARERASAPQAAPHPRYLATSAAHYVEAFALPPYLRSRL